MALDDLKAATAAYRATAKAHEDARVAAIAAAVAALKAGEEPADVAKESPFEAVYIRRLARRAGIEPARPGRRPKRVDPPASDDE